MGYPEPADDDEDECHEEILFVADGSGGGRLVCI